MKQSIPPFRSYLRIILLPAVLIITSTGIFSLQLTARLQAINQEISGIRIVTELQHLKKDLSDLRDLILIRPVAEKQTASKIRNLHIHLDKTLESAVFNPAEGHFIPGDPFLNLRKRLPGGGQGLSAPDSDLTAYLTGLIHQMDTFIRQSAERSRLILDPEPESYSLIDLLINAVPAQLHNHGRLRFTGLHLIVNPAAQPGGRETGIENSIVLVAYEQDNMTAKFENIFSRDPHLQKDIAPFLAKTKEASDRFTALSRTLKQNNAPPVPQALPYYISGGDAMESFLELHRIVRLRIMDFLEERKRSILLHLAVIIFMMATLIGLLIHMFVSFYRKEQHMFLTLSEQRDLNLYLIESLPGLFYLIDERRHFVCWNQEFERITGYSPSEIAALHPADLVSEKDRKRLNQKIDQVFREGGATVEGSIMTPDGEKPYYATGCRILLNDKPHIIGYAVDISDRKKLENDLLSTNKLLRTQLDTSPDGILIADSNRRMLDWNSRFLEIWRIPRGIMGSGDGMEAIAYVLHLLENPEGFNREIERLYENLDEPEEGTEIVLNNGMVLERYSKGVRLGKESLARVWYYRDINRHKKMEEKLRQLATTDPLTAAFNRGKFNDDLKWFQEEANRYLSSFTLIAFDIDHFKKINDTCGHDVGDQALKQVVTVTRDIVRQTDNLYRSGGEEFHIILARTDIEGGAKEAERLCRAISAADFGTAGRITVSMGVAQYREGEELRNLLKRLDDALYRAKRKGRDRVEIDYPER